MIGILLAIAITIIVIVVLGQISSHCDGALTIIGDTCDFLQGFIVIALVVALLVTLAVSPLLYIEKSIKDLNQELTNEKMIDGKITEVERLELIEYNQKLDNCFFFFQEIKKRNKELKITDTDLDIYDFEKTIGINNRKGER